MPGGRNRGAAMSDDATDLRKQIEKLTAKLNKATAVIEGRQPLAMLRDEQGNVNLGKLKGKPPEGYALLVSPKTQDAIKKLQGWPVTDPIPHADAVRYVQANRDYWVTQRKGIIVPIERAAEIAALAQELEGGR
jgi:hypothetical protein